LKKQCLIILIVNDAGMVCQEIFLDLGHFLSFSHQDFFFHSINLFAKVAPMNKKYRHPPPCGLLFWAPGRRTSMPTAIENHNF